MNKQKKAFTLIELSITIMIIAILASIWFYSYVWYISDARDAERKADVWVLISSLDVYKQNRWGYPKPWDAFNITNNWDVVAYQWKMNKKVTLSTLDQMPFDPYKWQTYWYSITKNKQEAQVVATLENWDFPIAMLNWSYHTVSKNILPTIILAINPPAESNIEINQSDWGWIINRQYFIFNKWNNLIYDMTSPYEPVYGYEWLDLWNDVLDQWVVDFWQNSDYVSCEEIWDAWKSVWTWLNEYQILNSSWLLTNSWCTF